MYLVPPLNIDLSTVVTNQPIDDAPDWNAGTTYALNDQVVRNYLVYQSTVASNLGNDPALEDQDSDTANWLIVGMVNALACFDGVLFNRAVVSRGPAIDPAYVTMGIDDAAAAYLLDIPNIESTNAVVLFGIDASRVQFIALSDAGTVLYEEDRTATGRWVTSDYEWYSVSPSGWVEQMVFRNLPVGVARVVIALDGDDVRLGEVVCGKEIYVGTLQAEGTGGRFQTASRYEFNDYGRLTFVQRPSRRDMTYRVRASHDHYNQIEGMMGRMIGGLVAAVGVESRQTTLNFGILTAPEWTEDDPEDYYFQFTVKGVS